MLTKLPLPAVIGVFLLTATTAVTSNTTTTTVRTRTASTASGNSIANATTTTLGKIAEVTRNVNGSASGSGIGNGSKSTSVKDVPITTLVLERFNIKDDVELDDVRRDKTTTSLLPLQPPLNMTSTTTSTFLTPASSNQTTTTTEKHKLSILATPHSLSRALATQPTTQKSVVQPVSDKYSSQIRALKQSNVKAENANVAKSDSNILQHDSTKKDQPKMVKLLPAPVIEVGNDDEPKRAVNTSDESLRQAAKSTGYIQFDVSEEDGSIRGTATPARSTRMDTVNEVLSNLFPNGFTDIFRFSYASEQPTPAVGIPIPDVEETPKPTSVPSPETKITPAPSNTTTTTTTEKSDKSRGKAFFSYETSISKEYRRELRPGHTEIVVEKLELLPRGTSTGSGEFSDGSNLITKDELLRINRAAADSPVLPSLLMNPSEENSTATAASPAGKQAPIIILNDDDSADMEGISAEDNLIAESQNIGQRMYQLLPASNKPYSDKFTVQKQELRPELELSQRPIFVPEEQKSEEEPNGGKAEAPKASLSNQQLDTFQEHAEQSFRQLNLVQEAPSRKFLRNFNPVLSTGASTLTPKGVFHYEANALQPNYYVQAGKSGELATKQGSESVRGSGKVQSAAPAEQQYDKDAAQLRYFKEQQYLQQQQQLLQQQQQLLLQQQQQEQQRQQHEMLVQQQQELQRQEKQQQQQQQRQGEDRRGHQLFQPASQKPQQQQQQQQQLQQFHKELKSQQQYVSHHQQPPLQQHYAIFQQHPPPHEYKQTQQGQQQNQYILQQQQLQKGEEEKARKQQQEQQKEREEQLRKQQQQAQHEKQQQQQQQALQYQQAQYEKQQKQQQQASQLQQSKQSQQQKHTNQPSPLKPVSKFHTKILSDSEPASASLNHQTYQHPLQSAVAHSEPATPTPHSVVFVTLNTPSSQASRAHSTRPAFTQKSPYEYASEITGAVSQHAPSAAPTPPVIVKRPQGGYTFVEVQKSVNIHNKLITEKDGKLVEEHETFYPQQQYAVFQQQAAKVQPSSPPSSAQTPPPSPQHQSSGQAPKPATAPELPYVEVPYTHYPLQYAQQLSLLEEGVHPNDYYFVPKEYASLSANPINVQHIDNPEEQEEASSYTHIEQALPLHDQVVPQPHAQAQVAQEQAHPQQYVQYTQHLAQQPIEQHASEHITQHQPIQQPPQQTHGEHHHQPAAEKEIIEKVVEHQVEKIVERPVHIPYPVHVQQFIDRPYPVQEIVETHIPVPYPVPEPVPVPVHVDRYIERPYPVEKIVEKRVPYPVEKVVEKIVEKEIPIEVEKVVEKVVDRPVPIPIRVPVAVPVPYAQQSLPDYHENADIFDPSFYSHPNALGWSEPTGAIDFSGRSPVGQQIPPKVLQNYYTRMLKKLLPQVQAQRSTAPTTATTVFTHTQARPKPPSTGTTKPFKSTKSQKSVTPSGTTPKQHSFKIGDIRFDLKPPPPPPTGPEWTKGSRYIYNTLPHDLSVADTSDSDQLTDAYSVPFPSHNEPYDEFQRWRNGHSLKRSPQFGRNLQMEYGFKPPLVPSVEINDQGIPLNADTKKAD